MNKTMTNVKDVIVVAAFAYTCVQAARGWYGLGKGVKEVIQDKIESK